eukprot:TRINITY_DN1127_c0_g1_i1.p1 TRINITY_DN1127_c0_g1~~TRINITY_DN1127_c0_g1_i1.p1  ORF type:complete len:309 (-),score=36.08 TRINITY_DN1127_c0_g1_i1:94-1020(-)
MALSVARQRKEPKWALFVTGGFAAMTAESFTMPIDTAKVRLQLQGIGGFERTAAPYRGFIDCLRIIPKEEGFAGLYKGLIPGLSRQLIYSSIRMGIYEPLRNLLAGDDIAKNKQISFHKMLIAGGTAGAIGSLASNPTDLLKIRMQGDVSNTRYTRGIFAAFVDIFKAEGLRGLWTGVVPSMQRAFVVNAAELATYDKIKHLLISNKLLQDGTMCHFASSMVTGFVAASAVSPVDVTKTRLMSQKTKIYSGVMDCMLKTVKNEGFFALYKGFLPLWFRIGPWCVVMFISYEQYRKMFGTMLSYPLPHT